MRSSEIFSVSIVFPIGFPCLSFDQTAGFQAFPGNGDRVGLGGTRTLVGLCRSRLFSSSGKVKLKQLPPGPKLKLYSEFKPYPDHSYGGVLTSVDSESSTTLA